MAQQRKRNWQTKFSALALAVLIVTAIWKAWGNYSYVELPSLAADAAPGLVVRVPRSELAARLDERLRTSHRETMAFAKTELASWKDNLLKRFDEDYKTEMTSVTSAMARNGQYIWDTIRNGSPDQAQQLYDKRVQELFSSKVGAVAERLESAIENIIDFSAESIQRHLGTFAERTGDLKKLKLPEENTESEVQYNAFDLSFSNVAQAVEGVEQKRRLAQFLLSKLTKYYTSKGDVAALGSGIGHTCGLHPSAMAACQRAVSIGATASRELLKKAGIRIGTTSALAGPFAKVFAVGLIGWESWKLHGDYAEHLKSSVSATRSSFKASLDELSDNMTKHDGILDKEFFVLSRRALTSGL